LKKVVKIITSMLVMSLLMVGTLVPAASAAKPTESKITLDGVEYTLPDLLKEAGDSNSSQASAATTAITLTDDQPLTLTLYQAMPFAAIKVNDSNMRYLITSSGTPLKTVLRPVNAVYQGFIGFDSVDVRPFNMIQTHFIPGLDYELFVLPETYPATVTVSMSTSGSNASWVYSKINTSFTEKNILMGGQTETFGMAFETPGTYKITVTTGIAKLTATFSDSRNILQNQVKPDLANGETYSSVYTFQKTITDTDYAQDYYGLTLYSQDSPSTGATYTVSVEKL